MLQVIDLSCFFGEKVLFEEVSFQLNPGEKVGLVGINGSGKSTLLKLIFGSMPLNKGGKVTGLAQEEMLHLDSKDVLFSDEPVSSVLAPNWHRAYSSYLDLSRDLESCSDEEELSCLLPGWGKALEFFERMGGFALEERLEKAIQEALGRGLPLATRLSSLSGGERMRVSLASLLVGDFKLALLDEPTNNLDKDSRDWLMEFLPRRPESLLVVSHDREFLDRVCDRILYLESHNKRLVSYQGNYSWCVERRRVEKERLEIEARVRRRLVSRLEEDVRSVKEQALKTERATTDDFLRARSKKVAAKAKAREARLSKIIERASSEPVGKERGGPRFVHGEFGCRGRNKDSPVIAARHMDVGFLDKVLVEDLCLELRISQRVVISGQNGCGKSTLIKTLLGLLKPLRGELFVSSSLRTGYLSQARLEDQLDSTVQDLFFNADLGFDDKKLRRELSRIHLYDSALNKKIYELSEGERTRLSLILLLAAAPEILVLDEPTNHLDLVSIEALEDCLRDFTGGIVLVSHDSRFLENLSPDRVYEISDRRLRSL